MLWEPCNVAAPSHRAVGSLETNCQCWNENLSRGGISGIFVCRLFEMMNSASSFWCASVFALVSTSLQASSLSFQYHGEVHCAVANIAEEFIALLPISRRSSLRCCHYHGVFKAPLPTENSTHYWQQLPIAPLSTAVCSDEKARTKLC